MKKWRYLLLGVLIGLLTFLTAGCRTSYWEWSGTMSNESGSHVQPFNPDDQAQRSNAITFSTWTSTFGGEAHARK